MENGDAFQEKARGWAQVEPSFKTHALYSSLPRTRSMAKGVHPDINAREQRRWFTAGLSPERMLLFVGRPRRTGQTVPGAFGWLPICRRPVHLP